MSNLIVFYRAYEKAGWWAGTVIASCERAARKEFCNKYKTKNTRGLSFYRCVEEENSVTIRRLRRNDY